MRKVRDVKLLHAEFGRGIRTAGRTAPFMSLGIGLPANSGGHERNLSPDARGSLGRHERMDQELR